MEESGESQVIAEALREHRAAAEAAGHVEPNEGRNQRIGSVGVFASQLQFGMRPNMGKVRFDG